MNDINIKANIPERCPKCGNKAFWRKSPKDTWRCHFCDPPSAVKRQQEQGQQ